MNNSKIKRGDCEDGLIMLKTKLIPIELRTISARSSRSH
jgi:hypothetical protein